MEKRTILIANDDGIGAEGIARLAAAALPFGRVFVAAPDNQCSGMSQKLTIRGELPVAEAPFPVPVEAAWAVGGTPADCVKAAVKALLPVRPDVVLTGINRGYNAGFDIAYSGTVGAALEAVMNGVPAIAFSAHENGDPGAAEAYLPVVLEALLARPAEPGLLWNVNFPDCTAAQCKGVLYGRRPAACSFYDNDYVRTGDALSIRVTNPGPDRCREGSDIHAVLHGYVSVGAIRSPLFLTDREEQTMYDVIALGELLVDLAERTKDENGYPTLAANPGGAPGNFLAALSAYGKKTAFLAKVGDDTFGHLLTGTMRRAGIDTRGILISPDTFTTLAFVTFDAHGDRSFAFARKPGADTQLRWDEIAPEMLAESRVFHFGSLSCTDEPARSATQKAAAYARMHGKLITYDPNYRAPLWKTEQAAKEQILWGLSQADIVKISDEETQFLWGCGPEEGAKRVLALGAKLVMVTLGPKGCLLKNAQAEFSCGCPKVHPIDTTGAGDIFGGSAVSRFLELQKVPEALTRDDLAYMARYAAAAASLSTEVSGAIPSIPKKEAVLQKMQEEY